jgi:hypothetical protein
MGRIMISDPSQNLMKLYEIYQEEGATEAVRSVAHWGLTKTKPKMLLNRGINFVLPSTSIWDSEWDICIILDGCRADTFESVFNGESTRIRSVASTSQTWISRTFDGIDTSNIGYLTGNPFAD